MDEDIILEEEAIADERAAEAVRLGTEPRSCTIRSVNWRH